MEQFGESEGGNFGQLPMENGGNVRNHVINGYAVRLSAIFAFACATIARSCRVIKKL